MEEDSSFVLACLELTFQQQPVGVVLFQLLWQICTCRTQTSAVFPGAQAPRRCFFSWKIGVAASTRPACSRGQSGDRILSGLGLPRSFRVQRLPAGSQRAQPSAARAPLLARRSMANTLFDTCGRRRSSNKLKLLFEQQRRRLS